jgi:hypothetical protein
MTIYLYASGKNRNLIGFTEDASGQNLPEEYGPWYLSNEDTGIAGIDGNDPITQRVRESGFVLATKATIH